MKKLMGKLEELLELGGTKKDIAFLIISGISLVISQIQSITVPDDTLPFNIAWAAIVLCGVPIILEAVIGLVTAFDIKADVLVSLALIASVCIGEDFAASEVTFIMQLGGLLEDLTVAKARAGIEKLVQSADAGKAKIVGLADRWATWVVVIALTAAALTWAISGEIIRAVTILVVFCPCSLVLATPTAIMAGIGNVTKHGFLVREGDALERLAKVKKICFDKTGTLTYGKPEVIDTAAVNMSGDELLALTASVESCSEHPLGKAILKAAKEKGLAISKTEGFAMTTGKGVRGNVDGREVLAGNVKLLAENGISIPEEMTEKAEAYIHKGSTVIFTAVNSAFAGFIVLSDTLRAESREMIRSLKGLGVEPVRLTGDNENAAKNIAGELGISEVKANCLPEDKLNFVAEYGQSGGAAMIGGGINDAPALKRANVGIAMGGVGSDIAVDAADIALVDDEVKELPHP